MSTFLDVLGGLDASAAYKAPCAVATTADMTNTMIGLPVIDGYQCEADDRILVWENSNETTNGIYNASLSAWSRAIDFSNSSAILHGTQVLVVNGSASGGFVFVCNTPNPTVGSTNITFTKSSVDV